MKKHMLTNYIRKKTLTFSDNQYHNHSNTNTNSNSDYDYQCEKNFFARVE